MKIYYEDSNGQEHTIKSFPEEIVKALSNTPFLLVLKRGQFSKNMTCFYGVKDKRDWTKAMAIAAVKDQTVYDAYSIIVYEQLSKDHKPSIVFKNMAWESWFVEFNTAEERDKWFSEKTKAPEIDAF